MLRASFVGSVAFVVVVAACDASVPDGSTSRGGSGSPPELVDGGGGGGSGGGSDAAVSPDPPGPGRSGSDDAGAGAGSRDAGAGGGGASDAGPPAGGAGLTAEEQDLLDAINAERAGGGLAPVAIDERLLCAARRHALDVGGSGACGHVGADGSWPWDRAMACGFPQMTWTVNEIAAGPGFTDGADAVWGWSHSSGHYAALMHPRAAFVGVAVHRTCFIALFDCCVAGSE
jgi:hypothetical protein